jgi:hypothetical protein
MSPDKLPPRTAMEVFLVFAFAYFLSTLIRAITATLAPVLTQEFSLNARDLGLLAGAYFLGFSMTQLPMGHWLDRFGPKRVIVCFLMFAVLGCAAFSMATSFAGLLGCAICLWCGCQCLFDGTPYRVSPLVCSRYANAGEFLDADDRFAGHGGVYFAGAVVDSCCRVAWIVCMPGAAGAVVHRTDCPARAQVGGGGDDGCARARIHARVCRSVAASLLSKNGTHRILLLRGPDCHANPVGGALDGQGDGLQQSASCQWPVWAQCGHALHIWTLGVFQPMACPPRTACGSTDCAIFALELCFSCYCYYSWSRTIYGRSSHFYLVLCQLHCGFTGAASREHGFCSCTGRASAFSLQPADICRCFCCSMGYRFGRGWVHGHWAHRNTGFPRGHERIFSLFWRIVCLFPECKKP